LGLGNGLDILEEDKSLVFAKIESTACGLVAILTAITAGVLSDGAVSGSVLGLVLRIHFLIGF
jgi:hypothetical protein